jgi:hypothetical protein
MSEVSEEKQLSLEEFAYLAELLGRSPTEEELLSFSFSLTNLGEAVHYVLTLKEAQ